MKEAKEAGLTKQTYVWIVTQPVIGSDLDLAPQVWSFNICKILILNDVDWVGP